MKEQASPTWPPQNSKVLPDSIKNSHLLYLCCLPPRPMVHTHSLCVWSSLGANLRWTFYNQDAAIAAPKLPSTKVAGKNTQVCKGNSMFTNIVTHVCLHENINLLIHTLLVYVICSGLGVFYINISIGLLN